MCWHLAVSVDVAVTQFRGECGVGRPGSVGRRGVCCWRWSISCTVQRSLGQSNKVHLLKNQVLFDFFLTGRWGYLAWTSSNRRLIQWPDCIWQEHWICTMSPVLGLNPFSERAWNPCVPYRSTPYSVTLILMPSSFLATSTGSSRLKC